MGIAANRMTDATRAALMGLAKNRLHVAIYIEDLASSLDCPLPVPVKEAAVIRRIALVCSL